MKRGLVFTTLLFGRGHLHRTLILCKELKKSFDIDLIVLGEPVPEATINLVVTPDSKKGEPVYYHKYYQLQEHVEQLKEELHDSYDFFITEMLPFGTKLSLKPLIEWLVHHLKTKVYCSLREVVIPGLGGSFEKTTVQLVSSHYDAIFYHSDPEVFKLEESFGEAEAIKDKVIYTGFITEEKCKEVPREKVILLSCAGRGGAPDLQKMVVKAAGELPEFEFQLIQGTIESDLPNVKNIPFIENFNDALARSSLAITQSGSTIWNLYQSKTPALLYPYRNGRKDSEMLLRAEKFEAFGLAKVIHPDDFLGKLILSQINTPYPDLHWDIEGAGKTREHLLLV